MATKEGRCPICQKPSEEKFRPFCSKRCAQVDLGKWLSEGYRVASDETDEEEANLDKEGSAFEDRSE